MARLHIRLHDRTDRDIIDWLDSQQDKTAAVKNAIRAALGNIPGTEPAIVDLGAIRAVFEAVLDERLQSLVWVGGAEDPRCPANEDPELAARLDALEF